MKKKKETQTQFFDPATVKFDLARFLVFMLNYCLLNDYRPIDLYFISTLNDNYNIISLFDSVYHLESEAATVLMN